MNTHGRCRNPDCGYASGIEDDRLGRVFRCPRCQSKLGTGAVTARTWFAGHTGHLARRPPRNASRSLNSAFGPLAKPPAWGCDDSSQWLERLVKQSEPDAGEASGASSCFHSVDGGDCGFARSNPLDHDENAADSAVRNRIGRYQVRGKIGEGQYAVVYRGHDPLLGRPVALKWPRPDVLPAAKMKERFLSEARALARLKHHSIISVFELGVEDGQCFIAMGLVEGQSLEQLRHQEPNFVDVPRAVRIVADLADALEHVHSQGILHRDVKPANVLIDHGGRVYLSDFGIAHAVDSGEIPRAPGTLLGTPAYTAPEQASGEHSCVLPASDQYSLGVLFYELLCGRTPFCGPPLYVLFQAMNQEAACPRTFAPSVPRHLAEICMQAVARSPADRFASCGQFAERLRAWLGGQGTTSPR